MFQQDLKDVPADVVFVWTIQKSNQPIGLDTYNKVQKIINDNPKYFPWEYKYKSIPQEVHDAFLKECYPERFEPIVFSHNENVGKGIFQLIEESKNKIVNHNPTTDDILKSMQSIYDKNNERELKRIESEKRIKSIWDKHYKKYKLECREF